MTHRKTLLKAQQQGALVRLRRSFFEGGWVDGYVAGQGRTFVVLEVVDAAIRLDGFECFRIADITEVHLPSPTAGFQERALSMRGLERRARPAWDLDSASGLLRTASRSFPTVTLHVEERAPEVCFVGRVVGFRGHEVEIHELSIHGQWANRSLFELDAITRLDFGGAYEDALSLVAGQPSTDREGRLKGPRPTP